MNRTDLAAIILAVYFSVIMLFLAASSPAGAAGAPVICLTNAQFIEFLSLIGDVPHTAGPNYLTLYPSAGGSVTYLYDADLRIWCISEGSEA